MSKQPTTKQKTTEQPTTKLPAQAEKLTALLQSHPVLRAKLLEALETDRFFITLSFQKKKSPTDPHDLHHFWHRQQYSVNDVLPSLRHLANDYKAKEMPEAEVEGDNWH